uniref:Na_Ca_ex domain-containing protein n=1 Tax=Anisakis simplex TaxID=6269 RepID=A0A0M3J1E1_ANISI
LRIAHCSGLRSSVDSGSERFHQLAIEPSGGVAIYASQMRLNILILLVILCTVVTFCEAGTNCSAADATKNCIDGMIVPIWRPFLDLSTKDRVKRGIIFFFVIAYCFLGVSIVADRFMSSIEVITSQERTVHVKRPGLEPLKVKVRIWNDTVSNLTLMALG